MARTDPIRLVPSVYHGGGREGDFRWMIDQPSYADALFIYNDNTSQSAAFLEQVAAGDVDPSSVACQAGGGNGAIRPYQCAPARRAAGVPTGPGFRRLADGQAAIDAALAYVQALVETGRYRRVIYSAASARDPDTLGSGIFVVPEAVLTYIPARLKRIVALANAGGR